MRIFSGTTLNLGGFNQTIGTLTLGTNNGAGKVIVSGSGSTLTLTGGIITSNHNGGAAGNFTVSTLDLNNATQNFFLGGHGSGATVDELSISSVVQNGGINIVGSISTAAVTLSNANNYSGATSISLATLRLAHLNALQNSPLETSGSGTVTLAAGAGSYTLGGLTGTRNLSSVITGTPTNLTTLTLNPGLGSTHTYSGAIGDLSTGMAVTKTGQGTQVLSGTNAYTGATTVSQGTLQLVGGSQASAITVNSGASLGFTLGSPTTSTAAVDLSAGTVKITGSVDNASDYLLMTASSITGTPTLDSPIANYALQKNPGNTELKLVYTGGGGGTPYEIWAGPGVLFDADANGDGIDNGLAFLLGASGPTASVTLPTVSQSGGGLVLSNFLSRDDDNRGTATLSVQHSSDLGISDPWVSVPVTDAGVAASGVTFSVTLGTPNNTVTATISSSQAASGKLFGRLKATP